MSHLGGSVQGFTRRQFLLLAGATAVGTAAHGCADRSTGPGGPAPHFFTPEERETIDAACEALFPRDQEPGASDLGAVEYIDRFLAAFDVDPPLIFSRGPYSGRNPYPDSRTGSPSQDFPGDGFGEFIPLQPLEELAWRIRLYGSTNVPGGDFNDRIVGETRGLRDIFRDGAKALAQAASSRGATRFAELSIDDRNAVIAGLPDEFVTALYEQTAAGLFAAPEYGGNHELGGWRIIGFDGDSQPLGYSLYDPTIGDYRERPDKPVSTANPGEDFSGISEVTRDLLRRLGFVEFNRDGS
jgi:hypothetical protein